MSHSVRVFQTPDEMAQNFATILIKDLDRVEPDHFYTIALSGGSTPELFYSVIGDHFSKSVKWENVHFFWGDERCVPPDSRESNYGMTRRSLFGKINIPESNIHRIRGEFNPAEEASRYALEIEKYTRKRDGLPLFDLIILGLGEDGHTASLFPSTPQLLDSEKICDVTSHPVSMQKRITLTGRILNNACRVAFLVTGGTKAEIVEKILNKSSSAQNFPASMIVPLYGELTWLLDKEAASFL